MKKQTKFILILLLMLLTLTFVAACNHNGDSKEDKRDALATPIMKRKSASTNIYEWKDIENATEYKFTFFLNNILLFEKIITEEMDKKIELFSEDFVGSGEYTLKLVAIDKTEKYKNSEINEEKIILELGAIEIYPIVIKTADDFLKINSKPSFHYVLNNDIDFTGIKFVTMCDSVPFTGTLNGKNYTLKNIKMDNSSASIYTDVYVGIFGRIVNANIKNLKIENFESLSPNKLYGTQLIGVLGALASNSNIENIHTKNTNINWTMYRFGSTPPTLQVGGLLGIIGGGTNVINCSANSAVAVKSVFDTEFITEDDESASQTSPYNSYFRVYFGGLIAYARIEAGVDMDINISNSFSTGNYNINANDMIVGGLVGASVVDSPKKEYRIYYTNCYSSSNIGVSEDTGYAENGVTKFQKRIGLLVGDCNYIVMDYCYADVSVTKSGIVFYKFPADKASITDAEAKSITAIIGFIGYNRGTQQTANVYNREGRNVTSPRIFKDCYYNVDKISNNADSFMQVGTWISNALQITGLTSANKSKQSSYRNWDFEKVWTVADGGMPTLK